MKRAEPFLTRFPWPFYPAVAASRAPGSLALLEEAFSSPERLVRAAVVQGLQELSESHNLTEPAHRLLERALDDTDVNIEAIEVLTSQPEEVARPLLERVLQDEEDSYARWVAVRVAGR